MGVYDKLTRVQVKLKAPKNQFNKFGNYNYRSCEDILEALKPTLEKEKATVFISDSIEHIEQRYYVKATATFIDSETGETVSNTAYAREAETKKGSDESQITGASSSYARKYALNGLFLIDDTKDEDTDERQIETKARSEKSEKKAEKKVEKSDAQLNQEMIDKVNPDLLPDNTRTQEYRIQRLKEEGKRTGKNDASILATAGVKEWSQITDAKFVSVMNLFARIP